MRWFSACNVVRRRHVTRAWSATGQAVPEVQKGWRPIFDGKSLDGWEHVGPGEMVLKDGVIRTEGGMGLCGTRRRSSATA